MDLFDTMDATDLNKRLKDLMDGLSVKVHTSSLSNLHAHSCIQIFYPIAHAVSSLQLLCGSKAASHPKLAMAR